MLRLFIYWVIKMFKKYKFLFSGLALFSLLFLFSCKEEEQNRILNYNKGVYLGKEDEKLKEDLVNSLSQHVSKQSYN
ncbi:MAG: hypothetical protein CMN50_09265 [SAR116 cluster bacterium]|nr:hypothetical protein [SAR116 cluster bacterium]